MTRILAGLAEAPTDVDVLVVGLGVTGVGCALDAVARGLSVLAVDASPMAPLGCRSCACHANGAGRCALSKR